MALTWVEADEIAALMQPGPLPDPLRIYAALRPPWMAEGLCRGQPAEVFFPAKGASLAPARELCAACPSRAPCLAYAMANPELVGVWAGTSARERRALRRKGVLAGAHLVHIATLNGA